MDDILRSLTGRSCQSWSSGSVLRLFEEVLAPLVLGTSPSRTPPVDRFVPLTDMFRLSPQPTCSRPPHCFTLGAWQQHGVECHIVHYMMALYFVSTQQYLIKPGTERVQCQCQVQVDIARRRRRDRHWTHCAHFSIQML